MVVSFMLSVGLMSGTSLDGIDAVLVDIIKHQNGIEVKTLASETIPFDAMTLKRITDAMNLVSNAKDLCSLNVELGMLFAKAANHVIKKGHKNNHDISFIASHGQTIWHIGIPEEGYYRSTLQLGEPAVIAQVTGIKTISNFRSADMSVGGQGAPLVPFADYVLFHDDQKNRALHNLGGISNLTVIKKHSQPEDMMAFDTGPANVMINEACQMLFDKPYDSYGDIARSGHVNRDMLEEILAHPYFNMVPPKSTGREMFGKSFTSYVIKKFSHVHHKDIIRTLTEVVAISVKEAYEKFVFPHVMIDEIIFSGGGSRNTFLLELMKEKLPQVSITTSDTYNVSIDDKEAIAFAILGYETLHHRPSNIPSATGARKKVILGSIHEV